MEKIKKTIDKVSLRISSAMLFLVILILFINIILRYLPGFGGFKWYMESAQYLNVWSMFFVGISISLNLSHLNVNIVLDNVPTSFKKILIIITSLLTMTFYFVIMYSGGLLALRSRQVVSTMPIFRMSHVFWIIPIAAFFSMISTFIGTYLKLRQSDSEEHI